MLLSQAAAPVLAQQMGQAESRIQVTSELVLVNVVAHDKKGNLVRDLKKGDFTLFFERWQEAGNFPHLIRDVDDLAAAGAAETTVSGAAEQGALLRSGRRRRRSLDARDRRLILLFFDSPRWNRSILTGP